MTQWITLQQHRRAQRRRIRLLKIWIVVMVTFLIGFWWWWQLPNDPTESVDSVAADIAILTSDQPNLVNSVGLSNAISQPLEGTTGRYAVVVKNLKTGESSYQNEHQLFDSASLYKLWVMATVYDQINRGQLTEDEALSDSIPNLNRKFGISPDQAELTEGSVNFSVNSALTQMITISHNYAAMILYDRVKHATVADYLQTHQLTESSLGDLDRLPQTTAADIASFYEKLYYNQLADPVTTDKMLRLLKNQKLNHKLPKYLPTDIVIAHKTGELGMVSHDTGIVYTPKGDYIIVVLSETNLPAAAEDRIGLVSQSVYNYFLSQ